MRLTDPNAFLTSAICISIPIPPPVCIPGAPSRHGWQRACCSQHGNTRLRAMPRSAGGETPY
eukprot:5653012-Alexandrium_andersonii.AAC.1